MLIALNLRFSFQNLSVNCFFDQESIGFPCKDYVLKLEDKTDISLSCHIEIQQKGNEEMCVDLKVPLGEGKCKSIAYLLRSDAVKIYL